MPEDMQFSTYPEWRPQIKVVNFHDQGGHAVKLHNMDFHFTWKR